MHRRRFLCSLTTSAIALSAAARMRGQSLSASSAPPLLADTSRLVLVNRTVAPLVDPVRAGVRLSEVQGEGLAILSGSDFGAGTIEIDLRGRTAAPRSFLGIAFHGVDPATFDAIYFSRFTASGGDARAGGMAVHYHSPPRYTDARLRNERPGRYELPIIPAPAPDDWFHVRIVVASTEVQAFIGEAAEPCLDITLLNDRESGFLGLWVGNYSGGEFADLKVTSAQDQAK
jgi:hypothetical protein